MTTRNQRQSKSTAPDQEALYLEFIDSFYDDNNTVSIGRFDDGQKRSSQYTGKQLKDPAARPHVMAEKHDLYITPCPQANEFNTELNPQGKMRRSDIAQHGRACWVDCDDSLTPEKLALAKKWGCWIIESGSKTVDGRPRYHLWFPLDTRTDPRIIRYLNMHLRVKFDGDYKCDLAAYLRLPGTINHKNGQNTPVRIVHKAIRQNTPERLAELLRVQIPSEEQLGQIRAASAVSLKELREYLETYSKVGVKESDKSAKKYLASFAAALGETGLRHESMLSTIPAVLRDAKKGEINAQHVLDILKGRFSRLLKDETGRRPEVEFDEMVAWSLAKSKLEEKAEAEDFAQKTSAMAARLLGMDELFGMPDPIYLIDGWLTQGTFARIVGAPGSFKTFAAIHMAMCVATGKPFFGGVDVVEGKVLYLIAEGVDGFKKRIQAWVKRFSFDESKKKHLRFLPDPIQVKDAEWLQFIEVCREEKPILIVLDTQARITLGIEESSNSEMGEVVQRIEELRKATGACILLVHHAGHGQERGRGASAMLAAVNTELLMTKAATGNAKLENQKEKDEADGRFLELIPEIITLGKDTRDKDITSVVLHAGASQTEKHHVDKRAMLRQDILAFVEKNPGCSSTQIRDGVSGNTNEIQEERGKLAADDLLVNRGTAKRPKWYRTSKEETLFG